MMVEASNNTTKFGALPPQLALKPLVVLEVEFPLDAKGSPESVTFPVAAPMVTAEVANRKDIFIKRPIFT
jgi:hypothetical protein